MRSAAQQLLCCCLTYDRNGALQNASHLRNLEPQAPSITSYQ